MLMLTNKLHLFGLITKILDQNENELQHISL